MYIKLNGVRCYIKGSKFGNPYKTSDGITFEEAIDKYIEDSKLDIKNKNLDMINQ